jgi:hypothetical protein
MIREFIAGKTKITYEPYLNLAKAVKSLGKNFSDTGNVIQARNLHSIPHPIWNTSGWTKEALFRAPKNPALLLRISPLVKNLSLAEKAVDASESRKIFYQKLKFYNTQLKQAEIEQNAKTPVENRSVLILPHTKKFQITPTENFEVLRFYKGPEQAEKYLKTLLDEKQIDTINFLLTEQYFVDCQDSPYIEQTWFGSLEGRSHLDTRDFASSCYAFGVFPAGEARGMKSELYSPSQISETLNKIGISGDLENTIFKWLRERN